MELLLQRFSLDPLALGKRSQRQWQNSVAGSQDQAQVDRRCVPRVLLQPLRALQAHQNQRRDYHDRRAVEHTAERSLSNSQRSRLLGLAQTLGGTLLLRNCSIGLLSGRGDGLPGGEDIDARAHFFSTHEENVQGTGAGDGGEGDQTGEDEAGVGGEVLEAGDEVVQADGYGAGGCHG